MIFESLPCLRRFLVVRPTTSQICFCLHAIVDLSLYTMLLLGLSEYRAGDWLAPPPPSFTLTAKCTVITTLLVEGRGQQTEVFIHFVICVFSATFYLKRYNSFHFLILFRLFICYTRLSLLICLECCCFTSIVQLKVNLWGFDIDAVVGRVRFGTPVRCPGRPHNSFCLHFIQVYISLIFSYIFSL